MTEQEIYEKAKRRVKAKKIFFIHFGVFAATAAFLFIINYLTFANSGMWWAIIPTAAWGIGIVTHYISVFGIGIISQFIASFGFETPTDDNWEEKELEKEMEKLRSQKNRESKKNNITYSDDELELKKMEKLRDESEDKDFL